MKIYEILESRMHILPAGRLVAGAPILLISRNVITAGIERDIGLFPFTARFLMFLHFSL